VEVDYRNYEVTVDNFLRVLLDRHEPQVSKNKRLMTDENSNILIYMSGHGGNDFLKFQDAEEISSKDIADAFHQMHIKKRYNEILFIADTCQAESLYKSFYSPNVVAIGSSRIGESSYSHHNDANLGISVIDRFTYYTLEFFSQYKQSNLQHLFSSFNPEIVRSHADYRTDLYSKPLNKVDTRDFFASKKEIIITDDI
jgi:phosphatidylinositol glycan class K